MLNDRQAKTHLGQSAKTKTTCVGYPDDIFPYLSQHLNAQFFQFDCTPRVSIPQFPYSLHVQPVENIKRLEKVDKNHFKM